MLVEHDSAGNRTFPHADALGSVIARADNSGTSVAINTYDEYGAPGVNNAGRFGYTGQVWLGEAGVYHYKARAYKPELGIFLQTDPVGQADNANLYAYVGNDPVNFVDPLGLCIGGNHGHIDPDGAIVCPRLNFDSWFFGGGGGLGSRPVPTTNEQIDNDRQAATRLEEPKQCLAPPKDPTSQNLADEQKLFDTVSAVSDLVAVSAGATAIIFPPAATVAIVAKGFSTAASLASFGFSVAETAHTGDWRFAGGSLVSLAGGALGGHIASRAAFGRLAGTQLRINGKFGPNAFRAYGDPIRTGGRSLGAQAALAGTC